jgi:hypothetical protein
MWYDTDCSWVAWSIWFRTQPFLRTCVVLKRVSTTVVNTIHIIALVRFSTWGMLALWRVLLRQRPLVAGVTEPASRVLHLIHSARSLALNCTVRSKTMSSLGNDVHIPVQMQAAFSSVTSWTVRSNHRTKMIMLVSYRSIHLSNGAAAQIGFRNNNVWRCEVVSLTTNLR